MIGSRLLTRRYWWFQFMALSLALAVHYFTGLGVAQRPYILGVWTIFLGIMVIDMAFMALYCAAIAGIERTRFVAEWRRYYTGNRSWKYIRSDFWKCHKRAKNLEEFRKALVDSAQYSLSKEKVLALVAAGKLREANAIIEEEDKRFLRMDRKLNELWEVAKPHGISKDDFVAKFEKDGYPALKEWVVSLEVRRNLVEKLGTYSVAPAENTSNEDLANLLGMLEHLLVEARSLGCESEVRSLFGENRMADARVLIEEKRQEKAREDYFAALQDRICSLDEVRQPPLLAKYRELQTLAWRSREFRKLEYLLVKGIEEAEGVEHSARAGA